MRLTLLRPSREIGFRDGQLLHCRRVGIRNEAADVDAFRMKRIAAGDSSALAELYDAHGSAVYTLARRILGHPGDAEEVVQEVFAQAWRQAGRYDPNRASVAGWLLMITRARALDALRARQARPDRTHSVELPELPAHNPGPEMTLLSSDAIQRVRAVMREFDETLRAPVELAYFEGLSQSEIAERLNQPLGTVKTRLRNAVAKLREALNQREEP